MFDDNHMDDLMRSVLDSGQEEVPTRVWDGISAGLDRIGRRKKVVLWVRRAGVTAAAAAIATGVLLNIDNDQTIIPEATDNQMIAVIDPEETNTPFDNLTAYIKPQAKSAAILDNTVETDQEQVDESESVAEPQSVSMSQPVANTHQTSQEAAPVQKNETTDSWIEDEVEFKQRKFKTSLVVSGVAGTNNPQSNGGISPMKSPSLGKQYSKTTIEQTSTETLYGIPLSFGAGVKLHLTDRWSLGMGLNYTLLTSKFNGKYIKVTDGMADAPIAGNIRNVQHYLGIPINAYYDIVRRDFVDLYAYAGGTVEKCIMNTYQVQASTNINHREDVKGVQLSANLGIGVEFRLSRYIGLYIDPSLRYYFNNGQPKSIRSAQPLMLGFEMGLRFNL